MTMFFAIGLASIISFFGFAINDIATRSGGFHPTPTTTLAQEWANKHHYVTSEITCEFWGGIKVLEPCVLHSKNHPRMTKTIFCPNTQMKVDGETLTKCREHLDTAEILHKPLMPMMENEE